MVNDKLACAYCGAKSDSLHRDHVVPRSRGGSDNATNIVMSCQPCNSAKSDLLPSEWLGDRCPAAVLIIEIREHGRLKKDFGARRDRKWPRIKKKQRLYALSLNERDQLEFVGVVRQESPETVRIEAADAFLFQSGLWNLSGCLYDVPRARCQLFGDRDSMIQKAAVLLDRMRVASGGRRWTG